jgi:hypothetical protein
VHLDNKDVCSSLLLALLLTHLLKAAMLATMLGECARPPAKPLIWLDSTPLRRSAERERDDAEMQAPSVS